jgi:hypothetical protein
VDSFTREIKLWPKFFKPWVGYTTNQMGAEAQALVGRKPMLLSSITAAFFGAAIP